MRKFEEWIEQFNDTIQDYDFFVDFEKVYNNVNKIEKELNILNSLIGDENIEENFKVLLDKEPSIIKCIPSLLALRKDKVTILESGEEKKFDFSENEIKDTEYYAKFMKNTGLFDLLKSGKISDLKQYMIGVEVGLDTNARKNRIGYTLEKLVEKELKNISNINYRKDVAMQVLDGDIRRLIRPDFYVICNNKTYVIEVSYMMSYGSKNKELIKLYKENELFYRKQGVTYILILDGMGWKCCNIPEFKTIFEELPYVFNLKEVQKGILGEVFK